MSRRATCPDAGWWQELLEGRLSTKEQAGLNSHLESCADCQQELERLTAGDAGWPEAARALGQSPGPTAPPLRRLIDELEGARSEATVPAVPLAAGAPALTFLRPPTKPRHHCRVSDHG